MTIEYILLTRKTTNLLCHASRAVIAAAIAAIATILTPNHARAQEVQGRYRKPLPPEILSRLQQMDEQRVLEEEKRSRPRLDPASDGIASAKFANPTVQIRADGASYFDRAFFALSSQAGIAILSEGTPLTPVLDDAARAGLRDDLRKLGDKPTFNQALDVIAAAYDYQPTRIDAHTALLFKKYSVPNDLPFVTAAEADHDMRETVKFLGQYLPDAGDAQPSNNPLIDVLARAHDRYGDALTKGVPFTDFSPDDQQAMQNYCYRGYAVRGTRVPETILRGLKAMSSPHSRFLWMNLMNMGVNFFGFEGPFAPSADNRQFPLSYRFIIASGGVSVATTGEGGQIYFGDHMKPVDDLPTRERVQAETTGNQPDLYAPSPSDYAPRLSLPATCTLGELTARLAARPDAAGLHLDCDPAIAPKTVNCFNEADLSPESALRAAARLYGLSVTHLAEKTWTLTMPSAPSGQSGAKIPEIVERLFPLPWRRAFANETHRQEDQMRKDWQQSAARNELSANAPDLYTIHHWDAPRAAREAIYRATVHRLRALIEPKLKNMPGGIFPMQQMTEEEKSLLLLVWSVSNFDEIDDFMRRYAVPYLDSPETAFVRGEFGDGQKIPSELFLGKRNARGRFEGEEIASMPTPKGYEQPAEDPRIHRSPATAHPPE